MKGKIMKYVIKMRNIKTGSMETYYTLTEDMEGLESSLEVLRKGGYEILDCVAES